MGCKETMALALHNSENISRLLEYSTSSAFNSRCGNRAILGPVVPLSKLRTEFGKEDTFSSLFT
ncbi:hypothetical protein GX563_09850 [Candidatus Bathyarchaeota archaeon]|nr:hypothetical protein [Candidatus Bathyarchaeota archaeon]